MQLPNAVLPFVNPLSYQLSRLVGMLHETVPTRENVA